MMCIFSFLCVNDLIWGFVICSYMLGELLFVFDLLFWNGDGINLLGWMVVQYLCGLCQQNVFVRQGFLLFGLMLNLQDVIVLLCVIVCEIDYIVFVCDSWCGVVQMGLQDRIFILLELGYIVGIINLFSKKKYGYYVLDYGFVEGFW